MPRPLTLQEAIAACPPIPDFERMGYSPIQAAEIRTQWDRGWDNPYAAAWLASPEGKAWRQKTIIPGPGRPLRVEQFPMPTANELKGVVDKGWNCIRGTANTVEPAIAIIQAEMTDIAAKAPYNPTDADILKLPASVAVPLYYTLCQYDPETCEFIPNEVVSAGLNSFQAALHEYGLRNRIYRLRTDMHKTVDMATGQQITGIIDLRSMRMRPVCDETSLVAEIAQAIIFYVIPVFSIFTFAINAFNTIDTLTSLRSDARKAEGLQKTVLDGAVNLIENERITNAFSQPAPSLLQDVPNPSVETQIAETTPTPPVIISDPLNPTPAPIGAVSPITELSESLQPVVPPLTPAGHATESGNIALMVGVSALILLALTKK